MILKLNALHELFPFEVAKKSNFVQSSMEMPYTPPHNLFKIVCRDNLLSILSVLGEITRIGNILKRLSINKQFLLFVFVCSLTCMSICNC